MITLSFKFSNLKRYYYEFIRIFKEHKLIESSYQVLVDDKLLPNNISQGFIVFEKLLVY